MGRVILEHFCAFIFSFFGLNDCMVLTVFRYFGWASLHADNEPIGGCMLYYKLVWMKFQIWISVQWTVFVLLWTHSQCKSSLSYNNILCVTELHLCHCHWQMDGLHFIPGVFGVSVVLAAASGSEYACLVTKFMFSSMSRLLTFFSSFQ